MTNDEGTEGGEGKEDKLETSRVEKRRERARGLRYGKCSKTQGKTVACTRGKEKGGRPCKSHDRATDKNGIKK